MGRLSVSKQSADKLYMERFSIKKLTKVMLWSSISLKSKQVCSFRELSADFNIRVNY